MTTLGKADELETLRASLDVERAQNKTLHADAAVARGLLASSAMLLEQAAASFTLAGGHEVAVEKLERIAQKIRDYLGAGAIRPDTLAALDDTLAALGEVLRELARGASDRSFPSVATLAERLGREWEAEAKTPGAELAGALVKAKKRRASGELAAVRPPATNDAARCDPFDVPEPPTKNERPSDAARAELAVELSLPRECRPGETHRAADCPAPPGVVCEATHPTICDRCGEDCTGRYVADGVHPNGTGKVRCFPMCPRDVLPRKKGAPPPK